MPPLPSDPPPAPEPPPSAAPGWDRRWHGAALLALLLGAVAHGAPGLLSDRMPLGDFPGYAAQIQSVHDALLAHGRVPLWCSDCYGGTTNFTSQLKERLAFPLAVVADPVQAAKALTLILRVIAGLGLYALVVRLFRAPLPGIVAGYAYAFGAFANHQLEHLDMALAAALWPAIALAGVELFRHGGGGWRLLLGVGVAVQLSNNWVYALPAPLAVALLLALQPWAPAEERRFDRARASAWLRRALVTLAIFGAFAASPLAWIVADAAHHRLVPAASMGRVRDIYIEHSPFLFVNRDNALAGWLERHQPPGFDLPAWDGGRRYLGLVALGVCLAALPALWRDARLRRFAGWALAVFGFQYWLALGPRTLLWQVGESLHVAPGTQAALATGLRFAAAACVLAAGAKAFGPWKREARPLARTGASGLGALGLALLAFGPTWPLWPTLAQWLPVLERQRSPGHFFDTAWFWFALLFALALVALARRIASPRLAHGVLAAIAALVVLDYAPSARRFGEGTPLAPLRAAASTLEALPGEGGSLRIALPPAYSPLGSWMLEQAPAGHAWGWLPWQAGRYWDDLYGPAVRRRATGAEAARYDWWPDAELLASARVQYFLLGGSSRGMPELPPPWRRLSADESFSLWALPQVAPLAEGYRAWVVAPDVSGPEQAAWVLPALRHHALLVHDAGDVHAMRALRAGARAVLPAEAASRPPWPPNRLAAPDLRWLDPLEAAPAAPPFPVSVWRRAPERVLLELETPTEPGMVLLREGYHPWWRARVDGMPAPVLRAQVAFLAVPVPAGARGIALELVRPLGVRAADGLTATAWLALALASPLLALRWHWRVAKDRRRRARREDDQSSKSASPLR